MFQSDNALDDQTTLGQLGSTDGDLKPAQAKDRLGQFGPNGLCPPLRHGPLIRLLWRLHNILSYLLLVAGLATALVIGFQLPLTDTPVMQGLFGTAPIGLREWGMLLLVAVHYMTPECLSMSFGLTAGEALAEIRRRRAVETVYVPSRGPS